MAVAKSESDEKSSIIRPLGHMERYQFHMLHLKFLGGTIVSCRYDIPPPLATADSHDRIVEYVEDALARVVIEHPALRLVAVKADTKRPAWVAVNQLDLAHHVQWVDCSSSSSGDEAGDGGGGDAVVSQETLRARIERCLDESYAHVKEGPQWCVVILFKSRGDPFLDIIFDYSHAIGDGMSGKIFHESLLRTLNNASATIATTSTAPAPALSNHILAIPPTARTLEPPVEKAGKFSVSPGFALSTVWKELRPPKLSSTSAAQAHWAPIRATPYRTHFRAFDIPWAALSQIQTACRSHKTTITGLLHALVVVSMATHIPADQATAFASCSPLDLRRHLVDSPEAKRLGFDPRRTIANYVTAMRHKFPADMVGEMRAVAAKGSQNQSRKQNGPVNGDGDGQQHASQDPDAELVALVWRCAARVRAELLKRVDGGLKNDIASLMGLVPDWRAQHRSDAQKPRPNSFVVTNLGVLDGGESESTTTTPTVVTAAVKDGKEGEGEDTHDATGPGAGSETEKDQTENWKITHSTFAISTEVNGAAFQVSPISVKDGAMCVGCSWQDCVVGLELAEVIVADMERWLLFLGRS
ncbi:hypothetical protein F5Y08DRAFT_316070 [Xylaria arbuscula]|nr:hypothetical protein F5Y08DRAFT_316070 [Xylaria arbuscula]